MAKTIITAALTGAITPHGYDVPETPEAIAACAYECWKAGASVVHLHMRDDQGAGVMDPVKFYQTISILRNQYPDCDVIVNCTSSGDNRVSDDSPYGNAVRVLHHANVPGIEMGTFDAGSFNWGIPGGVFHNSPKMLCDLGTLYQEKNIKPEFEIFDLGMLRAVGVYWKKGFVKAPLHFQFCLGVVGGLAATPHDLQLLLDEIRRVRAEGVDREIFTLCKNEKYGQLIENLENVEDSASQMADFALSGQTVAQQISMLAGLTAEDADAALQHILCTDRMATMYILPDGTAQAAEEDEEEEE